jgi:DNA-binding NtrC family response regulator
VSDKEVRKSMQDSTSEKVTQSAESSEVISKDAYRDVLSLPFHEAKERVVEAFEKAYLTEHLRATHGVVTHAAQKIGLPRQSLHRMLKRLGLGPSNDA